MSIFLYKYVLTGKDMGVKALAHMGSDDFMASILDSIRIVCIK